MADSRQPRFAGGAHLGGRGSTVARHGLYHCQQAAEKAVKGWLQSQDQPFPKTHDIEDLVAQAAKLQGNINQFTKAAAVLTPYVSAFRYPGGGSDEPMPSPEEFDAALQHPQAIFDFVLNLLPARVRSYSMNSYLGRIGYTSGYTNYLKLSDFVGPTPRNAFVFLDERFDSINDACFFVEMNGYEPRDPNAWTIVDFPGMYHDRSATFSFADGHGEFKRWTDARTTPQERAGALLALGVRSANNPDVLWIQERASRRISSK